MCVVCVCLFCFVSVVFLFCFVYALFCFFLCFVYALFVFPLMLIIPSKKKKKKKKKIPIVKRLHTIVRSVRRQKRTLLLTICSCINASVYVINLTPVVATTQMNFAGILGLLGTSY